MQISYTFHISSKDHAITTTRQLSSASKHNLRKYSTPGNQTGHYDSDKIIQLTGTDNLYRDVEKVYHEQFDQALTDYNKIQKRNDRKILDYMRYVSENGKSDLAVEVIIQLGDKEFWDKKSMEQKNQMCWILKDQLNGLRQYIPEFVIANAVIHLDESSPHMHVIGVPVSSGYRRGLAKQCSKSRVFTKDSLEKLQDVLRKRAWNGMEKNLEIFQGVSLKPKEKGRNYDFSKEFYIQAKKEKLDTLNQELEVKQHKLSMITDETTEAREELLRTSAKLTRTKQEEDKAQQELADLNREKQELEKTKSELSSLKQDVETLSHMQSLFHRGDRFEVDGEMAVVEFIYDYSRKVSFRTESGHNKELPTLDAIRAYRSYMMKEELNEECCSLKEEIADLKEEYKNRKQVLSEMDTVWNVFRHFPSVKDFIMKLGHMIKYYVSEVSLEDVKEAFRETVLGIKKQSLEHVRSRGRSR